jgi:Response regulator containing CheY-like receiver, AAA-type ATPase, and DNA-binding domains
MARILVVDDAKFMRMMVRDTVEKAGHIVVGEGGNGNEAVELYKKERPDVVTLDITMPEKDGIEAVKEIIAFDPKANVVMVSAMGQQGMVMEAIKSGAKNFIVKPFQGQAILDAIDKVL